MKLWNYLPRIRVLRNSCCCGNLYASCDPNSADRRSRAAAGLDYIDVYHRTGYYPQPLPFIPGLGGTGTVEAAAQDVRGLDAGDRVNQRYALKDAADAHKALEARATSGSTIVTI
jgi:hypothetical protein